MKKLAPWNFPTAQATGQNPKGVETHYTFDQNGQVIEEETAGTVRNYIYLGSKIIAYREENTTTYNGTDHLGSTIFMTNEEGKEIWTGVVTPFADQENIEGDETEHVMYTGKAFNPDTGL